MTCDEIRRQIKEGTLAEEASAHIRECPSCAAWQLSEALLTRYGRRELEVPEDLVDAVMARVQTPPRSVIHEFWRFAAATAAVVAITVMSWFTFDVEALASEVTGHVNENVMAVRDMATDIGQQARGILEKKDDGN